MKLGRRRTCSPFRDIILENVLGRKYGAESESYWELVSYNIDPGGSYDAGSVLFIRSCLQELYRQLHDSKYVTFEQALYTEKEDYWEYACCIVQRFRWMDFDEVPEELHEKLLEVFSEFLRRLVRAIRDLAGDSAYRDLPVKEAESAAAGCLEVLGAVLEDEDCGRIIEKYKRDAAVCLRLVRFKNMLCGEADLDMVFDLWIRFPDCVQHMDEGFREQLSCEIVQLLSQTDDYSISLGMLDSSCRHAMHEFMESRRLDNAVEAVSSTFGIMKEYGIYRDEFASVLNRLVDVCRRLL